MTTCINLQQQFGNRFRVTYEESYYAERGDRARAEEPWLMIIPCKHGEIYPFGDDDLVASTKIAGGIARVLKALPFATTHQDGTDGVDVRFPVGRFDEIAEIMKPKRRRQVSDAERRRLAEMGSKFRFTPGAQAPQTARKCVVGARGDSEHMMGLSRRETADRNEAGDGGGDPE